MRYYVYLLCYPNGIPFYVGKGTKNRVNEHEHHALTGKRGDLYDIIRGIVESGDSVLRKKVYFTNDEKDAYDEEDRLIRKYGLSNLANKIESAGRIIRDISKWKQKVGQSGKGRIPWNKGKPMSDEQKLKDSLSHIGLPSPNKGKKFTEQHVLNMSKSRKGTHPSKATRLKMGIAMKTRHSNLGEHRKIVDGIKRYWSNPDNKTRARERIIKGWITRRNKNNE